MPKKPIPLFATNVAFTNPESGERMVFPRLQLLTIFSGGPWGGDVITAATHPSEKGVKTVMFDGRPRDTPIYDYVCGLRRFQP